MTAYMKSPKRAILGGSVFDCTAVASRAITSTAIRSSLIEQIITQVEVAIEHPVSREPIHSLNHI